MCKKCDNTSWLIPTQDTYKWPFKNPHGSTFYKFYGYHHFEGRWSHENPSYRQDWGLPVNLFLDPNSPHAKLTAFHYLFDLVPDTKKIYINQSKINQKVYAEKRNGKEWVRLN